MRSAVTVTMLMVAACTGTRDQASGADRIGMGTTLKELEHMNGGPFTMMGFGWDLGGNKVSFNGGKLDHLRTGSPYVFIGLSPTDYSSKTEEDRQAVMGEKEFSSSMAALQRLDPRVEQMVVIYEDLR